MSDSRVPRLGNSVAFILLQLETLLLFMLPLLLKCLSRAQQQLLMQLRIVDLGYNQLMGTLPETWGTLTKVRPVVGSTGCC